MTAKKRINDKLIAKSSNEAKSMWNIINTGRKNKNSSQSVAFSGEEANDYFINMAKNVLKYTYMSSPLNKPNMNMTTNSISVLPFRFTKVGLKEVRDHLTFLKKYDQYGHLWYSSYYFKNNKQASNY